MAYKINRNDEYIVEPDGVASVKDVGRLKRELMQKTPEFYELEPAEVIKIRIDENDEDYPYLQDEDKPDWTKYGTIEARMIYSNVGNSTIIAMPLDTNIKQSPLQGEIVIVAEYLGQHYYTQKLNLHNSVSLNFHPGISKKIELEDDYTLHDFQLPKNVREIKSNEGDITFNGRFGQSIRFGSNQKQIIADDTTGKFDSPNVIIRAGQGENPTEEYKPVKEDINLDGSSLWMTTDQVIPFERSSEKAHGKTVPKKYDGKQVIINSDRIVFNTKLNSIHAFSKNEISMAADRRMNLESPIVNLADRMATEPAIAGDQLMDNVIWPIVDALVEFGNGIAPSMASVIDFKVPLDNVVGPSSALAAKLSAIKSKQKDAPKSTTVFVGNPKGPAV